MKNKIEKYQKYICVIPFISTAIILLITYVNLAKNKAGFKKWFRLCAIMLCATFLSGLLNRFVLSGEFPVLNWLASALIFTGANFALIDLQENPTEDGECSNKRKFVLSKKTTIWLFVFFGAVILIVFLLFVLPAFLRLLCFETQYPDLNGENDFSLCHLHAEEITQEESYELIRSSYSFYGSSTNVEGILEGQDFDECLFKAKIFDGVLVAQATKIDQKLLTLAIESTVTKGNFEIFVMVDGMIQESIEANSKKTITLEEIQGKNVLVILAGEGAEFSFQIKRSYE